MTRASRAVTRAGALALMALTATVAFAQTSTTSTSTPGVPETGAGGEALVSMILLAVSAALAIGAAFYLANRTVV